VSGNALYIPVYATNYAAGSTWTTTWTGNQQWEDIPFINTGGSGVKVDDLEAASTPTNYTAGKGDICRYLTATKVVSGNYRMPTANELFYGHNDGAGSKTVDVNWTHTPAVVAGYWTRIGDPNAGDWDDVTYGSRSRAGTSSIKSGALYNGYTIFPASGTRGTTGGLYDVGHGSGYWSSSARAVNANQINAYYTNPYATGFDLTNIDRERGFPVRCLLIE
jgi:hypothetical protein